MIRFGVAGNCDRFYAEGYKHSAQAPGFLRALGLAAYEYAAGHGVSIREETAREIGEEALLHNISVSIHAPYYINLATEDPVKAARNGEYFLASAAAVRAMGGNRVIFHPGSPGKQRREEAMARTVDSLLNIRGLLDERGFEEIVLCPETMGRPSQLGTLGEVIRLCGAETRAIPTIDFAHLHAASGGGIRTEQDFLRIIEQLLEGVGQERARYFHSHFSHIAYTAKGEKMHVTFADEGYGPDFALLAPVLERFQLEPTIICESRGTQADDALCMKHIYEERAWCTR